MNLKFKIQNSELFENLKLRIRKSKLFENFQLLTFNSQLSEGYVAISIMLIMVVVILGIVVTTALLGVGEGQSSLALTNGENSLHFVEGCMEDAMLKILQNANYAGGTITRPEGTCSITASKVNSDWTVSATSTDTKYRRTILTHFKRSGGKILITDWQEI